MLECNTQVLIVEWKVTFECRLHHKYVMLDTRNADTRNVCPHTECTSVTAKNKTFGPEMSGKYTRNYSKNDGESSKFEFSPWWNQYLLDVALIDKQVSTY